MGSIPRYIPRCITGLQCWHLPNGIQNKVVGSAFRPLLVLEFFVFIASHLGLSSTNYIYLKKCSISVECCSNDRIMT